MADAAALPQDELQRSRDMGVIIYLGAYVRLMCRELGVPDPSAEELRPWILEFVDPLNHATEAIWRATMEDDKGANDAVVRFRESLKSIHGRGD